MSGIFFTGPPYEILSAWRDGRVRLVVTPEIVREYEAVLDDDKFLACAVAGHARFIISGDKHLLSIAEYEGVRIMRPRAFLDTAVDELRRES